MRSPEWLQKHAELRQRVQERIAVQMSQKSKLVPAPEPRYDEVYEKGMQAWEELEEM